MDHQSSKDAFIKEIAAVFEENCLHDAKSQKEIQHGLIVAINYCLDQFDKIKKSAE
tara:strand:+ start:452 stop:619 length:168 start_codon:yes stop_codon:yes gene_type:complete